MELKGAGGPAGVTRGSAGGWGRPPIRVRQRAWVAVGLLAVLVLMAPGAGAQVLSLEAAQQLLSQAFDNLRPAPAWEGRVRLPSDPEAPVLHVTAAGVTRLRLDEVGALGRVHVWNQGQAYVGSEKEGAFAPSPQLLAIYRTSLLPFLFLEQVAGDPVVGTAFRDGSWSLQVQDRELGLLWVDVRGGLPAVIRAAQGAQVYWELAPEQVEGGSARARFTLPDGTYELLLQRLATGWVSLDPRGVQWEDVRPIDPPDEERFRPGPLGRLLDALDRFTEAREEGRVREARQAIREAIRLHPYQTTFHTQLGILEVEQGNWQGALAAFDQAFQIDPEDPLLLNNLAFVLIDTGLDPERGVALARQAVEQEPTQVAFLDTLGWGYTRTGRPEEGEAYLRQAWALAESSSPATRAEIAYHLAATLARLGREEEALELVEEALRLDPSLEGAQELRERLS